VGGNYVEKFPKFAQEVTLALRRNSQAQFREMGGLGYGIARAKGH
jgi:hypothetical protein